MQWDGLSKPLTPGHWCQEIADSMAEKHFNLHLMRPKKLCHITATMAWNKLKVKCSVFRTRVRYRGPELNTRLLPCLSKLVAWLKWHLAHIKKLLKNWTCSSTPRRAGCITGVQKEKFKKKFRQTTLQVDGAGRTLNSVQVQLSWCFNGRNFHVPARDTSRGYLKWIRL